jgi:hypothetical protein
VDEQDPSPAGDDESAEHAPVEAGAASGNAADPGYPPVPTAEAASRQAIAYRLLGAACALVGVLLVVGGLVALRGRDDPAKPAAAPSTANHVSQSAIASTPPPSTPPATATSAPPTTTPASTPTPTPTRSSAPPSTPKAAPTHSAPAARSPLTVLNNTTRTGLADQAAQEFRDGGWSVVRVGNFTGKIPNTTVYYDPGNAAQQRAAQALAAQFPAIDRVLPRYAGLPDSVHGVIVVLAPDWS